MALVKLQDFDPTYRETLGDDSFIGFRVCSDTTGEKIGVVKDILVDEREGRFRYFVVDIGFWIFGKTVLLPVGLCRISSPEERVYAKGLSKEQAKALPEFKDNLGLDYDYEEQVRGVYRSPANDPLANPLPPVAPFAPIAVGAFLPLAPADTAAPTAVPDEAAGRTAGDRDPYNYESEPSLYATNDTDHQSLKLYEERLIANKKRVQTGEVAVGKHVETETARAAVPVEKERVVIERFAPQNEQIAASGKAAFQAGEVARIEVYEETPDIHKEAFVREEVNIRKEVERETVNAEETLRREELDLNTQGQPVDDKREGHS